MGIKQQRGGRRAPPVSNAAYFPLQFWDGRAPSLEGPMTGPIENPVEMGNTHAEMLKTVDKLPGNISGCSVIMAGSQQIYRAVL